MAKYIYNRYKYITGTNIHIDNCGQGCISKCGFDRAARRVRTSVTVLVGCWKSQASMTVSE